MTNTIQVLQADFAGEFAKALSSSTSTVMQKLAPSYATLAKAYAIAAGREADVTQEELDAALDAVTRVVSNDPNLRIVVEFFEQFPSQAGALGASEQSLVGIADMFSQALLSATQDGESFEGEAVNFVAAVAQAIQNSARTETTVDVSEYLQAITDVIVFEIPELTDVIEPSDPPAATGVAV